MYLFRIHIRPGGGSASMKETFQYCLNNGILGVGWRTKTNRNTADWNKYIKEAQEIYKNLNTCKYIKKWIKGDDLVWTRSTEGEYYLAKVISGWEYWVGEEAMKNDMDIANIFRVSLQKVPIDMVPGKVVACFRAPRTIQEIANPQALEYSKHLWNTLSKEKHYSADLTKVSDIFTMLDDEETEDLVFIYLQTLGWRIVPNSRKADTMSFEYLAVNPKDGTKALAQVKTGNTPINLDNYSNYRERIFLFQSNEIYSGTNSTNLTCLKKTDLLNFLKDSIHWLPSVFKTKYQMITMG